MRILNDGGWSDFISDEFFISIILKAIVSSWGRVLRPSPDSLEDPVNRLLCGALQNDPAQRRLPFHVISQWEDIDADGNLLGRPDIRFMPKVSTHDDEFFIVECKRLRYMKGSTKKTANAAYIDGDNQGMTAFIDERYPAPRGRAGMVGYVLSSDAPDQVLSGLSSAIIRKRKRLQMDPSSTLKASTLSEGVYETFHTCSSQKVTLYHVILDVRACALR